MACINKAQSVLGEISERHLECSICFNRFREPKLLDCFHTFCLKCLKQLGQSLGPVSPLSTKLVCPLCRRETTLKANEDFADLPSNFTLSALVEEFEIQEQLLEGQGSEIKCQSCDEKNQATAICMDCAHFLCHECERAHKRMSLMASHKTYTMTQLQSGEIAYKSKLRKDPKCKKHPDENRNIYCVTCEQLVCITCSVLKHEKHSRLDLSEAYDKYKQDVAELIESSEVNIKSMSLAKLTTEKMSNELDIMFAGTNTKISRKADKEVIRIREREQKLKNELQKIYEGRVETFKTAHDTVSRELTEAEQTLNEMNQLMAQEIQSEILDLKPKLLDNLRELTKKQSESVPDKLHYLDFHDGDEKSLGRLLLEDKWELTQTKQPTPELTGPRCRNDSIGVFSNYEIVTVDREHKQLISYPPTRNTQSRTLSQVLQIPDLTDPCRVAVNKDDQLVILDGPAVKTFSREYQLLHQFIPGEDSDGTPTCLAVDDNNLIAVGFKDKEEITLHNPDGSLIRRLPAPMMDDQLVISNSRFIYINSSKRKMVSVDNNGDTVFTIDTINDTNEIVKPTSLCSDSHGNIYTCGFLFSWECQIGHFSPDGKYIGCVRKSAYPRGITCTPVGDLVLATSTAFEMYKHV